MHSVNIIRCSDMPIRVKTELFFDTYVAHHGIPFVSDGDLVGFDPEHFAAYAAKRGYAAVPQYKNRYLFLGFDVVKGGAAV